MIDITEKEREIISQILAIISDKPLSLQTHAELVEAFSESDLNWKVDIVDWAITSENFREIIRQQYEVWK